MNENNQGLEFVRYVLQQICKHPDDIELEQIEDKKGTLIRIRTHQEDMGKVIGKNGQTISALRLLVKSIGAKLNQKITLKVEDHEKPEPEKAPEEDSENSTEEEEKE